MNDNLPCRFRSAAYTMVEMMMVIAIFIIILGMAIAGWLNSSPQAKLRSAARMVSAQLNLARAKSVAERTTSIGVHFAASGENYYRYGCRLFYDTDKDGSKDSGEDYLPDQGWVVLPGDVVFAMHASGSDPECVFLANSIPADIVFDAKGRIEGGTDRTFYLTPGSRQSGPIQVGSYQGEPYFKFEVNAFNGRCEKTFYEVRD